jgi:hypothetical protein
LPVQLTPTKADAHSKLKKLLGEHAERLSGKTLEHFLDTLNMLKKEDSEN